MGEKKVVGKNVAIALGIIAIILSVGLVGAIANYTSIISSKDNIIATQNSEITNKNSQISNLQTWLNGNITYYQNQITSKDSQIASLQNQVNNLNEIVNLAKSTVWVDSQTVSQPASSYVYWTVSASYAGYVSVWVQTSTTTNTYVRVIYSAYGVNYDHQIGVGTGGTAVFPLLPCSSIEIRVGNTNLLSGATETVTITYHY